MYYGEFTEDYGGGVSQIATTTYNAAFWGGFEIVVPPTAHDLLQPLPARARGDRELSGARPEVAQQLAARRARARVPTRTTRSRSASTATTRARSSRRRARNCSSTSPTRRCVDIIKTTPFTTTVVPCPPKDPKVDPDERVRDPEARRGLDLAEGHTGYDVTFFRVIDQPGRTRDPRAASRGTTTCSPTSSSSGAKPKGTDDDQARARPRRRRPSTSTTTIP